MKYSSEMEGVYASMEGYNPGKKRNVLIVLDHMVVDIISNKKPHSAVLNRDRKLNVSLICIPRSYFPAPKDVVLHTTQ